MVISRVTVAFVMARRRLACWQAPTADIFIHAASPRSDGSNMLVTLPSTTIHNLKKKVPAKIKGYKARQSDQQQECVNECPRACPAAHVKCARGRGGEVKQENRDDHESKTEHHIVRTRCTGSSHVVCVCTRERLGLCQSFQEGVSFRRAHAVRVRGGDPK